MSVALSLWMELQVKVSDNEVTHICLIVIMHQTPKISLVAILSF